MRGQSLKRIESTLPEGKEGRVSEAKKKSGRPLEGGRGNARTVRVSLS